MYQSAQFSHSVVSASLWPHGLQHARPPCLSPIPRVYSNSCPSSQWCHPAIFPSIRVFSNESVLRIRWPKYWSYSFSISLSNEYSGLISFRIVWSDLLAVQGTLKKAKQRRIDAFELWCWRRLLRVPWTARRSNQSILKEISPEYSLERLMLKL